MHRRDFFRLSSAASLFAALPRRSAAAGTAPVVVSTWRFGLAANAAAWARLQLPGCTALDAVEAGVMVVESDPLVDSVGLGGRPNADGVVELDASIMNGDDLQAGAVASLRDIENPIAVARRVMSDTPHVLLVGEGARRFALQCGFPVRELLTPAARAAWETWRRERLGAAAGPADHDTIGMVALDGTGSMAAACTTSGLAWKLPGRVGDSPLIGHGMYCDSRVGGAVATGVGEEVIKVCGSAMVVEAMRRGDDPQRAVELVLRRIIDRPRSGPVPFAGMIALGRDGSVGLGSTLPGLQAAITRDGLTELHEAPSLIG